MRQTKRVTRSKSMFYNIFIGEYVDIVMKTMLEASETSEQSMSSQKTPMIFSGYVIDMDDDYILLGPRLDAVSQAVVRSEIVSIVVSSPEAEEQPVLSDEEKKQFN